MRNQFSFEELTGKIAAYLDCPCQIFPPMEDSTPLMEAYQAALKEGKQQGFTPVLVTADDLLWETLCLNADEEESPSPQQAALARAQLLESPLPNGQELLAQWEADFREEWEEEDPSWLEEIQGELADGEAIQSFVSFSDYSSQGTLPVVLAKIPTREPWKIFAWLPMGGWNDCPDPVSMMAVCKYWYEAYGAVPAAMSHDVLEFSLECPLSDPEAAWKLAAEQYAFCPDRIEQAGEGASIGQLADTLLQSTVWFFWWD